MSQSLFEMFAAFIPGPDIISCTFVDTYQEACAIADQYFKETGIVVTVEELAQDPLRFP